MPISSGQPLPWRHQFETPRRDGRRISAVVDAKGHVVCGSLIMLSDKTEFQTHAFIVHAVEVYQHV
jgi:hypothetical protein